MSSENPGQVINNDPTWLVSHLHEQYRGKSDETKNEAHSIQENGAEINAETTGLVDKDTWNHIADVALNLLEGISISYVKKFTSESDYLNAVKFTDPERKLLTETSWLVLEKHGLGKMSPELALLLVGGQYMLRVRLIANRARVKQENENHAEDVSRLQAEQNFNHGA